MIDRNSAAHSLEERGNDAYFTPYEALESLLEYEKLNQKIWEPSVGSGNLSKFMEERGQNVYSSDLVDYGYPGTEVKDFFSYTEPPKGYNMIVTNPPFNCWTKYAIHAKNLCSRVILLGKLSILESDERTSVLEDGTLETVYVFRNRLPTMHRLGWEGKKNSSSMAFCWFVFGNDQNDAGTILKRITCKYDRNKYKNV